MNGERPRSRHFFVFFRPSRPVSWLPGWDGWSCASGSGSSRASRTPGSALSEGKTGFLLVATLPVLCLFCVFVIGGIRLAMLTQRRIALQARLDSCAVRLAVGRMSLLEHLVKGNTGLHGTALGIYAARGTRLAGPIGSAIGGATEAALLRANRALYAWQTALLARAGAEELSRLRCRETPFSSEPSFCFVKPPVTQAFRRKTALFPDVKEALSQARPSPALARVSCRGARGAATSLEIRGDALLRSTSFEDRYVE